MGNQKNTEPIIDQFKYITEINQKMKLISEIYYIDRSGTIYMKSLVPFIEKIAFLQPQIEDKIIQYLDCIYLPNQFFKFSKNAKKTKLTYIDEMDKIILGQNDNNDKLEINKGGRLITNNEQYLNYINENFINRFYTKYSIIKNYINDPEYIQLSDNIINDIINNHCVYHVVDDSLITLTKNLFMDIKPSDQIFIKIANEKEEGFENKRFVIYKMINNLMTTYTITAYIMY